MDLLFVCLFGVNTYLLDMDRMQYDTNHYAANRSVTLPEAYTGSIVRNRRRTYWLCETD